MRVTKVISENKKTILEVEGSHFEDSRYHSMAGEYVMLIQTTSLDERDITRQILKELVYVNCPRLRAALLAVTFGSNEEVKTDEVI